MVRNARSAATGESLLLQLARSRSGVALVIAMAAVALVVLADRAVLGALLILLAGLFGLLVALAAMATVLLSLGTPPPWLADPDGFLPSIPRRFQRLLIHVRHRLTARPGRSPQTLIRDMQKQIRPVVWTSHGRAVPFTHLLIEVHPATAERIDSWMELPDVCAVVARHYADRHSGMGTPGPVVVSIAGDERVAPGRLRISGAFRQQAPIGLLATGWAAGRVGDPHAPATGGGQRFLEGRIESSPQPTVAPSGPDEDPDRTQVLRALVPPEDATVVNTALTREAADRAVDPSWRPPTT